MYRNCKPSLRASGILSVKVVTEAPAQPCWTKEGGISLGKCPSQPAECRQEDARADYEDEIIRGESVLEIQSMPVSSVLTDTLCHEIASDVSSCGWGLADPS